MNNTNAIYVIPEALEEIQIVTGGYSSELGKELYGQPRQIFFGLKINY